MIRKTALIAIFCGLLVSHSSNAQSLKKNEIAKETKKYKKAMVDYQDFKTLVTEVEQHRKKRLVSLDDFLKISSGSNVVILDARSDFRYNRKRLKGAIHLSFTDFTQENLRKLVPDTATKILIYCNNNFIGDQIDFATKSVAPAKSLKKQLSQADKPVMLALNIPTYINLYGYGYKNIYELDELVNVNDKRIKFEGSEAK
ncbi:rhodanese-like domain-containing protein [Pedobacter sp. KR3-3]|uniref:Rhodanese-like domain-containing protein n=1 Tax=Pedobacter albus TaxID=3113905 RepID=A0ABU7I4E5_9SPHI|nr:rhodanese-like domain-containing protein [Pedobacter sp. KR3-3]MEE1944342.1 rhodanese-like domain-containing protein [Pedobacter sp. KR3-3]